MKIILLSFFLRVVKILFEVLLVVGDVLRLQSLPITILILLGNGVLGVLETSLTSFFFTNPICPL